MNYAVLVINLPDAAERRERILAHLEEVGLTPIEMIAAVRGASLSAEDRGRLADDRRSRERYGRTLTAGELGCSLSHVRAYEALLASERSFALVLEDDAVLLPDVRDLLASAHMAEWMNAPSPRLVLMTPIRSLLVRGRTPFGEHYRLARVRRAWEGYGYVVNRAAAEVMRWVNSPCWLSADDWVAYRKLGGVDVRGLDPFCIGYLETAPSQLETDRRTVETDRNRSRNVRMRFDKWCRQLGDALYYRPVWGLKRQKMPAGWSRAPYRLESE